MPAAYAADVIGASAPSDAAVGDASEARRLVAEHDHTLVVLNGDAVIAIEGSGGTLSEIGFASVYDRPIASVGAPAAPHVEAPATPADAVAYVEANADG